MCAFNFGSYTVESSIIALTCITTNCHLFLVIFKLVIACVPLWLVVKAKAIFDWPPDWEVETVKPLFSSSVLITEQADPDVVSS